MLLVLWRIDATGEQRKSSPDIADRLLVGTPPDGILSCLLQIRHGPLVIMSALKVHGQLRGNLARLHAIARRLPGADLLMQAHPLPSRHARIHHLVVQGMPELIACGHRPVGPGLGATGRDELPMAGQSRIAPFERLGGQWYCRRHCRNGKRVSGHTGSLEQGLILARQALDMLLNILSQAGGDQLLNRRQSLLFPPGHALGLQEPLAYQFIHHRHQEQRIAAGTLVQEYGAELAGLTWRQSGVADRRQLRPQTDSPAPARHTAGVAGIPPGARAMGAHAQSPSTGR